MKTAATLVPPQPAPGHPPETPLGHAALVVGRGRTQSRPAHGVQLAGVSLRQSSLPPVLENRESTAPQDAFPAYAVALGWPAARVRMLDKSKGRAARRPRGGTLPSLPGRMP